MVLPVEGEGFETLYAKSDSDWAADVDSRKSVSCGVLEIGNCVQGVFVRGQATIATSSGEGELLACGSCVNEALGVAGLFEEMGFPIGQLFLNPNPRLD